MAAAHICDSPEQALPALTKNIQRLPTSTFATPLYIKRRDLDRGTVRLSFARSWCAPKDPHVGFSLRTLGCRFGGGIDGASAGCLQDLYAERGVGGGGPGGRVRDCALECATRALVCPDRVGMGDVRDQANDEQRVKCNKTSVARSTSNCCFCITVAA